MGAGVSEELVGGMRWLASLPAGERARVLAGMPSDEISALEEAWDFGVRQDLTMFACEALAPQDLRPARHHRLLMSYLERVARPRGEPGAIQRLMVLMPPGSAKSTYASVVFPAWFMSRLPYHNVIGASHTADLAEHFSLKVLNVLREYGPLLGLTLQTENVSAWMTHQGNEYKAAGIGGPITGRRADLAVVDDPFKGHAQADSEPERQRVWNWYLTELLTRMKPGGRIVVINTRWHVDDLSGRLLEQERDRWTVLNLPAFADDGDALGRAVGEPLWPEWETAQELRDKEQTLGPRHWAALFQQNPTPSEGLLFDAEKLTVVSEAPACVTVARGWDIAATESISGSDPDWTVGVKIGRTEAARYVVLDVVRFRGRPEIVERRMRETAEADGTKVKQSLPQDPGAAGKIVASRYAALLAGYHVVVSPETGSKTHRASPVSAQVNAGNLSMVRAEWNKLFKGEVGTFPAGRKDDQVDALSRAFSEVMLPVTRTRAMRINFMAR